MLVFVSSYVKPLVSVCFFVADFCLLFAACFENLFNASASGKMLRASFSFNCVSGATECSSATCSGGSCAAIRFAIGHVDALGVVDTPCAALWLILAALRAYRVVPGAQPLVQ